MKINALAICALAIIAIRSIAGMQQDSALEIGRTITKLQDRYSVLTRNLTNSNYPSILPQLEAIQYEARQIAKDERVKRLYPQLAQCASHLVNTVEQVIAYDDFDDISSTESNLSGHETQNNASDSEEDIFPFEL